METTAFLSLLCRSVFDENGEYAPLPGGLTISEDSFYENVGFSAKGKLSPTQVFKSMKGAYLGDKDSLAVLRGNGIKTQISENLILPKVKHEPLVRMLALYIRENKSIRIDLTDGTALLSDLLKRLSVSMRTYAELTSMLGQDYFTSYVVSVLPTFHVSDVRDPILRSGRILVPKKYSAKEISDIWKNALLQATCKYLDMPTAVYFKVMQSVPHSQRMDRETYMYLFGNSVKLGMTIKELVEACGLHYVSRVSQYEEHLCLVYKQTANSSMIYNKNSINENDCSVLPDTVLDRLGAQGFAKQIYWEQGEPYVMFNGEPVPADILGG